MDIIPVERFEDAMNIIQAWNTDGRSNVLLTPLSRDELKMRLARCVALLMDFDDTITTTNQWATMEKWFAREEDLAYLQLLREFNCGQDRCEGVWYRQVQHMENANRILEMFEHIDHAQWTIDPMAATLYGKHLTDLARFASKHFTVRPGTKALNEQFEHRAVVSMGVHDLITMILGANQFPEVQIAATKLKLDGEGYVEGVQPGTIVTSGSKAFASRAFLHQHRLAAEQALIIGDSPFDADLFLAGKDGHDGSVNGLIFDPSKAHRSIAKFLQSRLPQMWKDKLTFILFAEGYEGLVELIESVRA